MFYHWELIEDSEDTWDRSSFGRWLIPPGVLDGFLPHPSTIPLVWARTPLAQYSARELKDMPRRARAPRLMYADGRTPTKEQLAAFRKTPEWHDLLALLSPEERQDVLENDAAATLSRIDSDPSVKRARSSDASVSEQSEVPKPPPDTPGSEGEASDLSSGSQHAKRLRL